MAQRGVIKVQTPSGPFEIPVYDPADVEYPVWRVQTPSGPACVDLKDTGSADADFIRVMTAQGVKGVSTVTWEIIDDFEDGGTSEYTGGNEFQVVGSAAYEGNYGLRSRSLSNFDDIYSTSGLPRYPKQGYEIAVWFKVNDWSSTNNAYWEFDWGVQAGNPANTGYHLEMIRVPGGSHYFRLRRQDDEVLLFESTSVNWQKGVWYDLRVHWGTDGLMTCAVYNEAGDTIVAASATDTTHTSGGIGFWATANVDVSYDYVRRRLM